MAGKKQEESKRKPDMIARAKQSPDSEYWMTIGAAWEFRNKENEACYSIRLTNIPANWDHSFVLMPPKAAE